MEASRFRSIWKTILFTSLLLAEAIICAAICARAEEAGTVPAKAHWGQSPSGTVPAKAQEGIASWYAEFSPGINKTTANMEIFDHDKMTCATWNYPFETILEVTNLENGKFVYVRVNDRGPAKRLYEKGRIIDLTKAAFSRLSTLEKGLVRVAVRKACLF